MTYQECIEFDTPEAKKVREILEKRKNVKWPEDSIMYKILLNERVSTKT